MTAPKGFYMRFSIIVPVYNVEKYIGKCLNSLVNQSFDDYEIIVVDDETPDNSMAIVDSYQKRYPEKIRVIHQKNLGLGGARNTGVAAAQGTYLLFVDSDDYIDKDTLQTVDESLKQTPCDILVFQFATVTENGKLLQVMETPWAQKGIQNIHTAPDLLMMPTIAWNKAYRRAFFLSCGIGFPEKSVYEDSVIRVFLALAESVHICPACLYYYVQRKGSIMHSKISPRMLDVIKVSEITRKALQQVGLYDELEPRIEADIVEGVYDKLFRINAANPRNDMQTALTTYIKTTFPGFMENPFIHERVKQQMKILCDERYVWFHYRYGLLHRLKTMLLKVPLVNKLNQMRKKKY